MLYLDHVVWAGKNVEKLSEKYGTDFAVKSIKGGEHKDWGTYNFLTHLSNNCYLEWLGLRDEGKAKKTHHPLIQHFLYNLNHNINGPFQFALRTTRLDEFVEHFNNIDIDYTGPIEGRRETPDGRLLSWRMLFPKYNFENNELLPFLIEWDQPEHERIDVSLINHQAIQSINISGVSQEDFKKIYHLPNNKIRKNNFKLRNTTMHFDASKPLTINLK